MTPKLRDLFRFDRVLGAYQRKFAALDPDARAILADLGDYCNFDRTTACVTAAGTMDPIAMAYAEGRRDAFLRVLSRIGHDRTTLTAAIQQEMANDG